MLPAAVEFLMVSPLNLSVGLILVVGSEKDLNIIIKIYRTIYLFLGVLFPYIPS